MLDDLQLPVTPPAGGDPMLLGSMDNTFIHMHRHTQTHTQLKKALKKCLELNTVMTNA